ncbi:type II toxin-antitoxin system death-on-curing family toxin [Patescibacteria group bacterium]|nr:type II toxin-antitoxin system death-on-curing family toxin [Patescibacteria group bacterium]MBU4511673.1 type II toxin-antitoxin system death-on-curing family toxin [Patescibacteria group bacterium]
MLKKRKIEKLNKGEIIIYKTSKKEVELKVLLKEETVWLDARQTSQIFGVNRPAIVKHINNIYKTGELTKHSTCSVLEQVAADGKFRKMNLYNLDMIISVGYRVNSQKATQFRIWATRVLKNYLLKGYAINEKRLTEAQNKFQELQTTISFLQRQAEKKQLKGNEKEILNLLADYSKTLSLLEKYDKNKLKTGKGQKAKFVLEYQNCLNIISELRKNLIAKKEAGDIFGMERNSSFESVVKNLYQTFGKKELYRSLDEKSAHLLYLTIKDHPFVDGNKRIGSFLFVYFLDKNNYLFRKSGERKINDNGLAALALLIAESNPKEKDVLIKIIINLLND